MAVPDTEQEQDFMVSRSEEGGMRSENTSKAESAAEQISLLTPPSSLLEEEFDLSDLSVKPKEKTREDIIAEAEAAAFAESEA